MRLRLALASAVLAVLVASPAIAQGPPGGGMGGMGQRGPGRRMQMLFTGITLTTQQQAKVDSIEAAYQPRMRQLFQSGGMRDSTARAQMATLREQENRDLRAVLTPQQQPIFDKNAASMPMMGNPRRGPPGGSR
jgi:Spy/CpxP family protein refolding chaperone